MKMYSGILFTLILFFKCDAYANIEPQHFVDKGSKKFLYTTYEEISSERNFKPFKKNYHKSDFYGKNIVVALSSNSCNISRMNNSNYLIFNSPEPSLFSTIWKIKISRKNHSKMILEAEKLCNSFFSERKFLASVPIYYIFGHYRQSKNKNGQYSLPYIELEHLEFSKKATTSPWVPSLSPLDFLP